ncbi:MAG TPA: hypothetical protein V6D17_20460 [Candidatus Obscuribacterales bacterium]
MLIGIACLAVFAIMAALMYTRRISALLALPLMAILMAVMGGIPPAAILSDVISKGAIKLHSAYTTTMFGAVLAELMNKQGIAKALIRWVAEFAGDNPFILGAVMTLVTAVLFSTLGGLGAVIMVGTIVLPALLSLGISSITAGALFLFGISLGGMFNIAGWSLYMTVLDLAPSQIINFVVPFALIIGVIILVFLAIELRDRKNIKYLAVMLAAIGLLFLRQSQGAAVTMSGKTTEVDATSVIAAGCVLLALIAYAGFRHAKASLSTPAAALITPVIPLVLVLFFRWDFISAFIAGITYGVLTTWKANSITVLTRSILDGITAVIPAVVLMIGIGMLMNAVMAPQVASSIAPLLKEVIPSRPLPYIITFTLAAPLALYRGPLSLWGMGSGLVQLIKDMRVLPFPAIMAMLMSVGQVQGICDPTNTANIWIATYLGTDTQTLLRKTFVYAYIAVIVGLTMAVQFGYLQK